jgi:hypothetical protein
MKRVTALNVNAYPLIEGQEKLRAHFGDEHGERFFIRILNVILAYDKMMATAIRRASAAGIVTHDLPSEISRMTGVRAGSPDAFAHYVFHALEKEGGYSLSADEFDRELRENLEALVRAPGQPTRSPAAVLAF